MWHPAPAQTEGLSGRRAQELPAGWQFLEGSEFQSLVDMNGEALVAKVRLKWDALSKGMMPIL